MVSEIFPRATKVAAFHINSGFSHIHTKAPLLRYFPKTANPTMLARTFRNITSEAHCLSCLVAKSINVMQPAALVHITVTAGSVVPE